MEGASGSICLPPLGRNMSFSTKIDYQIAHKIPYFGHSLSMQYGKWDDVLQLVMYIAYGVFQSLL